jgi:glycosyltransferase involved in cell wall biosynthesis
MQVGIVVKEFPPDAVGGAETQTKRMASALHKRGHNITVLTKSYRRHSDTDIDYDVVRIPNIRFNSFLSDLSFLCICLLYLLWHQRRFEVIQCMMIHPVGFLGVVINKLTSIPYFAWIRGNDFYAAKHIRWKRWIIRQVLSDTLVLVQSSEIESDVRTEFPDLELTIGVLGNGVDLPTEQRTEPETNRILFVGRFDPKKGITHLFDAVKQIHTNFELVLVGDGDQREHFEQRADNLNANIHFEGSVPPSEVDKHYRDATVFVLPSIEGEGLPNVVLEAMSWGVPVVTTDSGGLPSIVEDGETGYLVSMRDEAALADRVEELLNDPEKREYLSRNAWEFVRENHSWESICSELERYYQDLTS